MFIENNNCCFYYFEQEQFAVKPIIFKLKHQLISSGPDIEPP